MNIKNQISNIKIKVLSHATAKLDLAEEYYCSSKVENFRNFDLTSKGGSHGTTYL